MRTMHPVLMTGYHGPNESLLPADEYGERVRFVRAAMARNGVDGLVIYGDCDEAALLTYLTNFFPRNRWAIGTLAADEDPVLHVAGGTRDLPFAAMQTWMNRAEPYGAIGKSMPAWHARLSERLGRSAVLGSFGFADMLAPVHRDVAGALGATGELVPLDAELRGLLAKKRPREIAAMREACTLLGEAATAFGAVFAREGDANGALLEAERIARFRAAHDVRVLASFDGGRSLEPFLQPRAEVAAAPLVAYLAVRRHGYWAAGFVTARTGGLSEAEERVAVALEAMIAGLRPGMTGDELAALAAPQLGGMATHPALDQIACHGIGLSAQEQPVLRPGGSRVTAAGNVYMLQVGVCDPDRGAALRSAMVHLTADGRADVLWQPA